MRAEPTKDLELVKALITNPILYNSISGQDILLEDFEVDTDYQYLLFIEDEKVVGCLQYKPLTRLVLDVHIFILPQHWGTGLTKEIVKVGHEWIKEQGYTKAFTRVPAVCSHVLKFLQRHDYHICGQIEKAIIFNHHLVSLFLFEREV